LALARPTDGIQGSESFKGDETSISELNEHGPTRNQGSPADGISLVPLHSRDGGRYQTQSREHNTGIPSCKDPAWSSPIRSVFGDGLVNLPPPSIGPSQPTTSAHSLKDDAFSVLIVRASLQNGYDHLLHATDLTAPLITRKFGLPLSFRSREEILMVLRWYLRPESAELKRLAAAHFDESLLVEGARCTGQTSRLGSNASVSTNACPDEPLDWDSTSLSRGIMNAAQLEGWLLDSGMRYVDGDMLEISTARAVSQALSDSFTWWGLPYLTPAVQAGHSTASRAWLSPGHETPHPAPPAQIRISRTRLIQLLINVSFCLDRGPAYSKASILQLLANAGSSS
jgi:hypothetical protein